MNPRLSIITVCLNAREQLAATRESVFKQSCPDFEWIVIDGNSSDGTQEDFQHSDDPRIRFFSEADSGIYEAMNKGLQVARGEWVWFINAGDQLFNEQSIEEAMRAAEGVEIIFGDAMVVCAAGKSHGLRSEMTPHRLPEYLSKEVFRFGMVVSHQSFVVLRGLAPVYDADRYKLSADLDWMLRILQQPRRSRRVEKPLSRILREGATMNNWKRSQWERFLILSRRFGYWKTLARHIYIVTRRIGHGCRTRFWR